LARHQEGGQQKATSAAPGLPKTRQGSSRARHGGADDGGGGARARAAARARVVCTLLLTRRGVAPCASLPCRRRRAQALRQAAERDARARMAFMQADTNGSGTIDPVRAPRGARARAYARRRRRRAALSWQI
jgi:hypothetical protein